LPIRNLPLDAKEVALRLRRRVPFSNNILTEQQWDRCGEIVVAYVQELIAEESVGETCDPEIS
jgi:hypothetical protein